MGCGLCRSSDAGQNSSSVQAFPAGSRPLALPRPYSHGSKLTSAQLKTQRNEFWSTRVEGNNQMWQSLRSASEALINRDLTLANGILNASNISTPLGSLELCYDELGNEYRVPAYCYCTPNDITDGVELSPRSDLPPSKRDAKGTPIKLKIRTSPGDSNFTIVADTSNSVYELKRLIAAESKLLHDNNPNIPYCQEYRQRIMFLGREILNAQFLDEAGFEEAKVVQVYLRPEDVKKSSVVAVAAN